jgi:PKD repeat protein
MTQIYKWKMKIWLYFLIAVLAIPAQAQLVTIGTGTVTNTNTGYPTPYGNYYWGSRSQFLILASEISAQGGTAGNITSLGFNVSSSTTSQGLLTCGSYELNGFTIKMKMTSATTLPATFDGAGLTTVHSVTSYTDVNGWNTHPFSSNFAWNGTSNILVDVCFNNTCYNFNAIVFQTNTTFTSAVFRWADATGNCTDAAISSGTQRPNMRLNIIGSGGGQVLPPIANFFPSQATTSSIPNDTVWINSPYDLVSTSTNATRSFWDLPNESNLVPGYSRNNLAWTSQQYIDTAKYSQRFRYNFTRRGFWPVRLLAVNDAKRDSLRDSIVKYIWVDTPSTAPKPNFFSARRKIGIGDYASLVDITSGGPFQWYWTFDPACNLCTTPPYFNNFFAGPTDQNPLFFGGDPGKFTICLQAWNDRGWDTICKKDYIEVINSINICSGSGASKSSEKEGFMFGPSGAGLSYTRSQVTGCPGFLLEPCADSIVLWVDRIKMLPSDTLVIHNGISAGAPVLRKIGGANVNLLPISIIQNGIRGGSRLFVRFQLGTATVPTPYDSAGFSIRWEALPATYGKPTASMIVQDTVFSLQPVSYTSTSTGNLMQYSWDTDGNGIYDSSAASVNRTFLITTPSYKKVCLVAYNCVGSDTTCKFVLFLPTTQKPTPRFVADKVQGFNTDTFRFKDLSLYGPSSWKWTFTPGTAQYLMGTSSTSKNPVMRFTQRTKYTVKLVATNFYGPDSVTVVDYVNIGAYDEPQCLSDINLADGSIGISRVRLVAGIDTTTNAYNPCYQLVGGLQAANLYRGKKHPVSITRPATTSPMDRKVWVDFNMDGLFTNDELVLSDMNAQVLTKTDTINVGSTQPLGSTRMRVGVTYAGTQLNPSVTFLGTFRDYVVNFPMDTVRPVASLNGATTINTEIHKTYVDPGVTALDNIEGNVSNKYEVIGTVDTSKVGPNYLKYIVRDFYNNTCDTLRRTVFVVLNQTGPTLTLNPPTQVYVEVYNKYIEPGFIAKDNQGNPITNQVIINTNLDTSRLGSYNMKYTVVDAFGMSAIGSRTIVVGDTTSPMVTPKSSPYIQQVGSAIDLTKVVDVTDNYWPSSFLSLTIQGSVDVNSVGVYFVKYVARDNTGNLSKEVTVRIDVKDTKAPTVVLNGITPMSHEVKTTFADPGVLVNDNYWPANTVVVTKKGTVNTNVLGDYTIWYIATDPSGNKDSISRLVKVVDQTKPRVDLLNITEVNLPRWHEYVDAPVALVDNYNTDGQMRNSLVVINSLPKNAAGNYFGDVAGLFSVRYRVTDLSGNVSAEATRTINVLEATGLNNVMNIDKLMSVYPNPSNGLFNMRLADAQSQDVRVLVYDMLGKVVHQQTMKGNNLQVQELDLTGSPKGFYLLRVQSGDQVYSRKIQVN